MKGRCLPDTMLGECLATVGPFEHLSIWTHSSIFFSSPASTIKVSCSILPAVLQCRLDSNSNQLDLHWHVVKRIDSVRLPCTVFPERFSECKLPSSTRLAVTFMLDSSTRSLQITKWPHQSSALVGAAPPTRRPNLRSSGILKVPVEESLSCPLQAVINSAVWTTLPALLTIPASHAEPILIHCPVCHRYVTVDDRAGRHLYYYLVTAESTTTTTSSSSSNGGKSSTQKQQQGSRAAAAAAAAGKGLEASAPSRPPAAPLVLWLTGGPGCSSMDAFTYENGPFNFSFKAGEHGGGANKEGLKFWGLRSWGYGLGFSVQLGEEGTAARAVFWNGR